MPEDKLHFTQIKVSSIGTNSNKSDTFKVGSNEMYVFNEFRVVKATGTYQMEVTDQTGRSYTEEAIDFPAVPANPNEYNIYKLSIPFQFDSNSTWTFKFTDTSGATNNVTLVLIGVRRLS